MSGVIARHPVETLAGLYGDAASHALLTRDDELALGRALQDATREIEGRGAELPLVSRFLLEDWDRRELRGRPAHRFGAGLGDTGERVGQSMERLRSRLAGVDAARRETDRLPARRALARALQDAQLHFERIEEAVSRTRERGRALRAARERGDRATVRGIAREFGMPTRRAVEHTDALDDAAGRRAAALSTLVLHNLRLVGHQAAGYRNSAVSYGDLVQEGVIGLMRAAEKYDPELGHRFSTYASWWIRQALTRAVQQQGRTVRVPGHVHDRMRRLRDLELGSTSREGGPPDVGELALQAGLARGDAELALQQRRPVASLDAPDARSERPLYDRIAVEFDFVRDCDRQREARAVARAVAALPSQQAEIVRRRFGLDEAGRPETLSQIADSLGLSRESTRKREQAALARLRTALRGSAARDEPLQEGEME